MRNIIKYCLFALFLAPQLTFGTNADFQLKAIFKRNPKIWGTYRLEREEIIIERGELKWRKRPPRRIGDMIISNGHLIIVRENKEEEETKIVVDKLPYLKKKNRFSAKKLNQATMARLFETDIKGIIPHKDLLEGEIHYKDLTCVKKRGQLECNIKADLIPN